MCLLDEDARGDNLMDEDTKGDNLLDEDTRGDNFKCDQEIKKNNSFVLLMEETMVP